MKHVKHPSVLLLLGACAIAALLLLWPPLRTAAQIESHGFEYVTIHWAGKDNTHLIRPGGNVEFIGPELKKLSRPDRCDERAFFMNAAINGLAKSGFEVTAMLNDDVVMRRGLGR